MDFKREVMIVVKFESYDLFSASYTSKCVIANFYKSNFFQSSALILVLTCFEKLYSMSAKQKNA